MFGVHPVVVEPVTWVSGREELLMVLGALGCIHFHITARRLAEHGAGGFEIVAAGISEALVATGAGLFVAIVALAFFNYLQVRVGAITATYARSCERFVQALLFLESAGTTVEDSKSEVPGGELLPA